MFQFPCVTKSTFDPLFYCYCCEFPQLTLFHAVPCYNLNDSYETQPDLARMALGVLAVPAMSDECERLFNSAEILLTDRRSRLKIDVIEASECLRSWYGPPQQHAFDDEVVGLMEGEPNKGVAESQTGQTDSTDLEDEEAQIVN